jgi:DNA-binding HxlR family transcriptional regulator
MDTTNYSDKKSPPGDDDPRIDAELTPLQASIVRVLACEGPCRFRTLVEQIEPAVESALSQALDDLQGHTLVQQSATCTWVHTWPRYRLTEAGRAVVRREAQRWVGAADALTEGDT